MFASGTFISGKHDLQMSPTDTQEQPGSFFFTDKKGRKKVVWPLVLDASQLNWTVDMRRILSSTVEVQ